MNNKRILYILVPAAGLLAAMILFLGTMAAASDPGSLMLGKLHDNPVTPASYIVAAGETIYDIAKKHSVSPYHLIIENRLTGELPLIPGKKLLFPKEPDTKKNAGDSASRSLTISFVRDSLIAPAVVTLKADTALQNKEIDYVWDLGNNRFSFDPSPVVQYIRPGNYTVRLVIRSNSGEYTVSNNLEIKVSGVPTDYTGLPYVTAERAGDLVFLEHLFKNPDKSSVSFDSSTQIIQEPALVEFLDTNILVARNTGFSRIKLMKNNTPYEFYLWVSPFPVRLSVEPEYDWYITQFDTGMYGNCGPAGNASAIMWATGKRTTVEGVRGQIGLPNSNGAVGYGHLLGNLLENNISAKETDFSSIQMMMNYIDEGKIIIVSFHCGKITMTKGREETDYVGRYYPDSTGHYLLIKGYTLDKKYFVVYDAIPGEWDGNTTRYADGVSMIGRNRFFLADEVFNAMRIKTGIVVERKKDL
ncbi:MAG: C39 family peptidase [Spirochaetales bacterium]|nr:C39 family peptidase [Spirochaetales bacterium]